jgi:hypothetical protein
MAFKVGDLVAVFAQNRYISFRNAPMEFLKVTGTTDDCVILQDESTWNPDGTAFVVTSKRWGTIKHIELATNEHNQLFLAKKQWNKINNLINKISENPEKLSAPQLDLLLRSLKIIMSMSKKEK